jgi:hypothetical protein
MILQNRTHMNNTRKILYATTEYSNQQYWKPPFPAIRIDLARRFKIVLYGNTVSLSQRCTRIRHSRQQTHELLGGQLEKLAQIGVRILHSALEVLALFLCE